MALRNCSIKPWYFSVSDDLINDFYIPTLSNCTCYKRVSAYFDSHILSMYSHGIENIISKNGHVRFIFSSELSERDFDLMKSGYEDKAKIEQGLLDCLDPEDKSLPLANLSHLIAMGVVDIRIAFTTNEGLFHDKFGLIEDGPDVLYFRGSNNETPASIHSNFESFETSCNWKCGEDEGAKIKHAEATFDQLWANSFDGAIVVEVPEVIQKRLASYDRGHLILNYVNAPNSVVFDYADNRVFFINNLANPTPLNPGSHFYDAFCKALIGGQDGNRFYYRDDVGYIEIQKQIEVFQKFSPNRYNVFVTPALRRFLFDSDLALNKRRSLGVAIKNHNSYLEPDFAAFKKIVNSLVVRPLYDPQMWGAFHIAEMKRSANFSVPGSGKTSIVLGAFAYLSEKKEVDKILMVGPLNSFRAWKREFVSVFGSKKPLKAFDYQENKGGGASDRHDAIVYKTKGCNLVLMNYDSLQNNVRSLQAIIDAKTMLVFDEVHRIKNTAGKRALSALNLCKRANYRVVLTGTPIPNGYSDIYNFLHVLFPDEYDSYFAFSQNDLKAADHDSLKRNTINERINPFFCVTTKDDLNVPRPEPDDLTSCYAAYDEQDEKLLSIVYKQCRQNTLLLYVRLIQAASNPSLLLKAVDLQAFDTDDDSHDFNELVGTGDTRMHLTPAEKAIISSAGMSKKYYKGIDLVRGLAKGGDQVLVWALFIDTLEKIKADLAARGIACAVIDGGVPIKDRDDIIDAFISKKIQVLIANPNTLAESVSLHETCHHAVYFEYSFNLVHMLQSRDRIHRVGLKPTDKTYYHYCMLDNPDGVFNTLDKRIYTRLQEKAQTQKDAIENTHLEFVGRDFKQDIEDLLSVK
jgi:superfamily II DNA or RNA helicase